MNIETFDLRKLTDADARALAELLCAVWPKPIWTAESRAAALAAEWREYDGPQAVYPRSLVVRDGTRVVAHAEAAPRTIGTNQGDETILALARVCTDPAERGRGLGEAVARAAFELVDDGTFAHSLFQTSHEVRPFYDKLGCGLVANRIVNSLGEEPTANPFTDEIAMRYPAAKPWPDGEIDLRGPGY